MLATSRYAIVLLVVLLLGGGIAYLTPGDRGEHTSTIPETGEVSSLPDAPTLRGAGKEASAGEESAAGSPAAPPPSVAASETVPVLFEGRVLDPNGRALAGVPVGVHPRSDSGAKFEATEPLAKAESDEQGRFEVRLDAVLDRGPQESKVPWLSVCLAASHPRWVFAVASFDVDMTEADGGTRTHRNIELRFKGTFSVRCRVVDEAGRPVAGATCRWGNDTEYTPRPDGRCYETTTDAEGLAKLEIPVMPGAEDPLSVFLRTTGVHLVHAEAEGYAHATSRSFRIFQPTLGQVVEAEIVLPAAHTITGRVVDDRGDAVPDLPFAVRLHREGADLCWNHELGDGPRTDADGGFILENVPAGAWTMNVWASSGYEECEMRVEVPSHGVTVTLMRRTTITVHYVRPDGTPLLASLYHAVREGEPPFSRYGARRRDGPLEINRLRGGRYQITVQLIGRVDPFVHELELETGPNDAKTFTVPETEGLIVQGRLLDSAGQPVAGLVTLRPEGADRDDSQTRLDQPVGEHGTFRFEGISPGRYVLWAIVEGHAWKEQSLEVTDGNPEPVDLRLGRGATVRVRLPRVPEGAAIRWQLQLLAANGSTVDVTSPEPDENGWLEFSSLPSGTTTVMLESAVFRTDPVLNDAYVAMLDCAEGETVEHAFPRASGVTLEGRVIDAKGEPHAQFKVNLRRVAPTLDPTKGVVDMGLAWKNLFTDDEGRFEAHGLLPGHYIAVNVRQSGVPIVFEVTEDAGQEVELRAR